MDKEDLNSADLLHGVPAIAAFMGLEERQARHLADTTNIPTFKIGGRICARRSSLRAWLAECEARARAVPPTGQGEAAALSMPTSQRR